VNAFSAAPVASVLLHDVENRGFISHASGESLERAIESSLSEVCRMTDLYQKGLLTASPSGNLENPDDHALYYVEKESFPSWFFEGIRLTYEHAAQRWRETNQGLAEVGGFSFQKFRCGPLYIARCTHPDVQDLFFGESANAFKTGILSTERIQKWAHNGEINLSPHCVA
jgi:hypothetical protein